MVEVPSRTRRGDLVATTLTGAWRPSPQPPELSVKELVEVAPLLLESGAGALGWWRVRRSDLRSSAPALALQQAYRLFALRVVLHERAIARVFALLRSAGVDPILVKGWAIARVYPEPGLRPYGDIDLCVPPEQYRKAQEVLRSLEGVDVVVDLHAGFTKLDERDPDDLYARSEVVNVRDVPVRVLGPEDHLRVLCAHLLRHGAWRPLWLCDIAVAVECRPAGFDWDRCLGRTRRLADWVACTIGLAHALLGAKVDDTPAADRAKDLPGWLVPSVLEQWHMPAGTSPASMREPMATYLRHTAGALQALRKRWPNAIEATIGVKGPLNGLPRLPFRLIYCLVRTARFLGQLPVVVRKEGNGQ